MRYSNRILSLLIGTAIASCGRPSHRDTPPDAPVVSPTPSAEETKHQQETAELKTELDATKKERDAAKAEAAKQKDEALKLQAQIDAKTAELKKAEQERAEIAATLANEANDNSALKDRLRTIDLQINSLKTDLAALSSFLTPLLAPLAGLWQGDLELGLVASKVCRHFYLVEGVSFKHVTVCKAVADRDYKLSFESGIFVDLFKLPAASETENNLEIHRQVATKVTASSCMNAGYPAPTMDLGWSRAFATAVDVNENGSTSMSNGKALALMRGDDTRGTFTCSQILARPNRVGLEAAVVACSVFSQAGEALAKRNDVGCFIQADAKLSWIQAAIKSVP